MTIQLAGSLSKVQIVDRGGNFPLALAPRWKLSRNSFPIWERSRAVGVGPTHFLNVFVSRMNWGHFLRPGHLLCPFPRSSRFYLEVKTKCAMSVYSLSILPKLTKDVLCFFCKCFIKNKLQKLEDALPEKGETGDMISPRSSQKWLRSVTSKSPKKSFEIFLKLAGWADKADSLTDWITGPSSRDARKMIQYTLAPLHCLLFILRICVLFQGFGQRSVAFCFFSSKVLASHYMNTKRLWRDWQQFQIEFLQYIGGVNMCTCYDFFT